MVHLKCYWYSLTLYYIVNFLMIFFCFVCVSEIIVLTMFVVIVSSDKTREDYTIWSLYLVFVGVTLPRELAFKLDSTFLPFFEGHENNAHCIPTAVNALAGAIFALYGESHQKERMKEFLVVRNNKCDSAQENWAQRGANKLGKRSIYFSKM